MSDANTTTTGPEASADGEAAETAAPTERKLRRALTQIRREGLKVAVIYAVADAALATLLVNLVASFAGVPYLPARLPIPEAVLSALRSAGVTLAEPTVSSGAVVGAGLGLLVFATEVTWRSRRPLVEQFAAANPSLSESLRTARDAVDRGRESRIVLRLYEQVLDELQEASSVGLISVRRVAVTVVVISLLSVATIQLAVVDITLAGLGGPAEPEGPGGGTQQDYTGLQDGSSILGEPEDVPAGSEELDASIDTTGSGSGEGSDVDSAAAYADSGFDSSSPVESQRAGFSEGENLEDAELIREYNLRIRQETDSDS
ncbi:DUF7502 family protein [Haloplanus halophilus]|uniref:DUF7502 family protein n=1 Tax=Haloplanus halophilus TaxID=2949993 RepID=UPI00203B860F|nr:hypothetical protein [Haloplanus sp. GDY1]